VPTDQFNTRSLDSVVGQRPEGQVLVDTRRSEGQVLKGEHLNAANFAPIDQFNTFSLGHFVGQQPGGQMPVIEQSDSGRRRRAAYQLSYRAQAPTDVQPHTRSVTVDVHEHSGSRDASVYFNGRQPRQSNSYSDVEGDTSEDSDPGYAQRRGRSRIRQDRTESVEISSTQLKFVVSELAPHCLAFAAFIVLVWGIIY